jgi:hypothetical protein
VREFASLITLLAESSRMKILAWEVSQVVAESALRTLVATSGQEEFAEFLRSEGLLVMLIPSILATWTSSIVVIHGSIVGAHAFVSSLVHGVEFVLLLVEGTSLAPRRALTKRSFSLLVSMLHASLHATSLEAIRSILEMSSLPMVLVTKPILFVKAALWTSSTSSIIEVTPTSLRMMTELLMAMMMAASFIPSLIPIVVVIAIIVIVVHGRRAILSPVAFLITRRPRRVLVHFGNYISKTILSLQNFTLKILLDDLLSRIIAVVSISLLRSVHRGLLPLWPGVRAML